MSLSIIIHIIRIHNNEERRYYLLYFPQDVTLNQQCQQPPY